jgi:hypothetical protein
MSSDLQAMPERDWGMPALIATLSIDRSGHFRNGWRNSDG